MVDNYQPLRFMQDGAEIFVVGDPRVDDLVTSPVPESGALLQVRARLASAHLSSCMIQIQGDSNPYGGASSGAFRFADRWLTQLQRAYPSGGTESTVDYSGNNPNTAVGIHMVNRGQSSAQGMNSSTPGIGAVAAGAEICVMMYGSNDIKVSSTPADAWEERMHIWVNHINSYATYPIVTILGNYHPRLTWTPGSANDLLWQEYKAAMLRVAATYPDSCMAINASETFESLRRNGDTSVWDADGTHLHDVGNAILADIYARSLLT